MRKAAVTDPTSTQTIQGSARPGAIALAEALATRICHDIAGMLGSMMGALELAQDDPAMADEALPVARDAADALGRRLRLLRAAWGGGTEPTDTQGLRRLAAGLTLGRRLTVALDDLPPGRSFSAAGTRVLLNMIMLGVESLGGDGVLRVREAPDGDIVMTITGPRAQWPAGFPLQLADPVEAYLATTVCGPRDLQGPFTAVIAHESGISLRLLHGAASEPAPPLLVTLSG